MRVWNDLHINVQVPTENTLISLNLSLCSVKHMSKIL